MGRISTKNNIFFFELQLRSRFRFNKSMWTLKFETQSLTSQKVNTNRL